MITQNPIDLLELYVAGVLPDEEMEAITAKVNTDAALKAKVEAIEAAFMAYAALHAPIITENAKKQILNIPNHLQTPKTPTIKSLPTSFWYRYGAIAATILLLLSLAINLYQYQQLQQANQKIISLKSDKQLFTNELDAVKTKYETTRNQFTDIRAINTQKIILKGTEAQPNATAIVYWNQKTQKVYLEAKGLPTPPQGKVYQLWRLSNMAPLTPHDAGLLTGFATNEDKLFSMLSTNQAKAFAITLEPKGGSQVPTLTQLYVIGQVS